MIGHPPRVMNVLPGAARTLTPGRGSMVVELQRHADHFVAGLMQQPRHDAAVNAA